MTLLDTGEALIDGLRGPVLAPGDAGYDEARSLFNGMIDRRPALIARCTGTADVRAAVRHAARTGLPLSVKGGGHGVAGCALVDDGVVIDLSPMRSVLVDPVGRTAVVQGGATWGDVDREAAVHGLAVTGGRVPSTGVGGLTLSSGSGWLERSLGLTADSLLAAELVTADGDVITVDQDCEPELLWGLKGGGGAFGVVTSFTFRLHPVPPLLLGGMLLFGEARAAAVLRAVRDLGDTAPDALAVAAALITAPPAPFVPAGLQGRPAIGVIVAFNGRPQEGEPHVAPLRSLGPDADLVGPMPYTAVQGLVEDGNPPGLRNYWKAGFLQELPDAALDAFLAAGQGEKPPFTQLLLAKAGGAIARVDEDATALSHRDAGWSYHLLGLWGDAEGDAAGIALVRGVDAALRPWAAGAYPNWLSDPAPGEVEASFGVGKAARLRALKARWDPTDRFARHTGLPWTGGSGTIG